jgi:F-type H+-transporting ATPase subunit b
MNINIWQIVFQIINFGVVAGALTFLMFKPIRKMLEERSDRIDQAQKAAELTLAEKKQLDEMKKKAQKMAEKEAAALLDQMNEEIAVKKKALLADAKKEAAKEVEKMQESFAAEKESIVEGMKKEFADAVIASAEKVVGSLDKKTHAKLIDAELKQLLQHI